MVLVDVRYINGISRAAILAFRKRAEAILLEVEPKVSTITDLLNLGP